MLYVIATPIGNLEDITHRAVRLLGEVETVICEDTRQTAKLLMHFGIRSRTVAFHAHSTPRELENILKPLREGKQMAYVTDAGTPGISDPGYRLTSACVAEGIPVVPVPGASAFLSALMASGLPIQEFVYLGFPPAKKGRQTFFAAVAQEQRTQVMYESKHRLISALGILAEQLPDRYLVVAKELTKSFEQFFRGTPTEILARLEGEPELTRGEFVLVVAPPGYTPGGDAVVKVHRQKHNKYLEKKTGGA